jgi:hypothetical protein
MWDLEGGRSIAIFYCDSAVRCCAFSGNRTVIAGDSVRQVHFLSLEGIDRLLGVYWLNTVVVCVTRSTCASWRTWSGWKRQKRWYVQIA